MKRKRKLKPKTLLLSDASDRSVERVAASLAFTSTGEVPDEYRLRVRARAMLRLLRAIS